MSYRFNEINIDVINSENYRNLLPKTIADQVSVFLPPSGSFDDACLYRYLKNLKDYEREDENSSMTLANRLRLAFQDMKPDTICGKFPNVELPMKRRLRCVAEYLIRAGEFDKVRDDNGKLIKRKGMLGKMVAVYKPTPKLMESLVKQNLLKNEP